MTLLCALTGGCSRLLAQQCTSLLVLPSTFHCEKIGLLRQACGCAGVGVLSGRRLMPRTRSKGKYIRNRRWVAQVKTDSTRPPPGLFNKSAPTIARVLRSRKVSPKGSASGQRMLTYYINRAGKNLSLRRRAELGRAKALLSGRLPRASRRHKSSKRQT